MLVLLSPRAQPFDKASLCPAGLAEMGPREKPGAIVLTDAGNKQTAPVPRETLEALPGYE
jgi:hypothetical protein